MKPIFEILEDAVPADVRAAAWNVCQGKRWYFGQSSVAGGLLFWKMDLEGEQAFDAVWKSVRSRCEALVGMPLRVLRQYANGQTYGQSGRPHADDARVGAYTLLYYPMTEWKDGWEGETVFYDERGDISRALLPKPNRAIFFDSRLRHVGRAPSRDCGVLRVSISYKLEAAVWQELKDLASSEHRKTPRSLEPG